MQLLLNPTRLFCRKSQKENAKDLEEPRNGKGMKSEDTHSLTSKPRTKLKSSSRCGYSAQGEMQISAAEARSPKETHTFVVYSFSAKVPRSFSGGKNGLDGLLNR